MRVIITGGTGLIGTELAKNLRDTYEVVVLSRNPDKHTFPSGVQGVRWDATTADNWGHLADGAYAIVNLAGASVAGDGLLPTRWTPERKQLIANSRLNAGQAVTAAIAAATTKPHVLIQSSAVGYYGSRSDDVLTEESTVGNDFLAQVCFDWEASTASVETRGVRRVVIRTGVVLSRDGGALPSMVMPFKFFAGGPIGSGKQWLAWIHMIDEVAAIRYLIENESAMGVYNLTAPNPVTNKQIGRSIGQVLGRPALVPTPGFAMKLMFGEVAVVLLEGQRAIPSRLEAEGFTFQYPMVKPALINLLNPTKVATKQKVTTT